MARFTPTDIVSQYNALSALNANFDAIATLIELCVFRDGTSPNSLLANIDMNNFKIQNLADGTVSSDAINKGQLDATSAAVAASEAAAAASAAAASTSEINAAASASAAATSETNAAASEAAAAASAASTSSGSYSPTVSNTSNCSGVTIDAARYIRVGDIVQVSVSGDMTVTTGGVIAQFRLTLPVASDITINSVIGSGISQSGDAEGVGVSHSASDDKAQISVYRSSSGACGFSLQFMYEIV